jgi:hypothetical protein
MSRDLSGLVGAAGVAVLVSLLGCAGLPPPEPREQLDPNTGVTLTVVDQAFVFARSRKDVAANARDYVTLVPVARNEAGKISLHLIAHRWSTVDARVSPRVDASQHRLLIVADGRDVRLSPLAGLQKDLFGAATLRPPVNDVQTLGYPIDHATLGYLARSDFLSLSFELAEDALPYSLWTDGRSALERWLQVVPSSSSPLQLPFH